MEQEYLLDYDFDCHAFSFELQRKAIAALPYGHPRRLGLEQLGLTGQRLSVMVDTRLDDFSGNVLTFRPGKNQKGRPRRVVMPTWFMNELAYYLSHNAYKRDKIYPFSANSFAREFNKMRHTLGGDFLVQKPYGRGWVKQEYLIQLKGIRKTYMVKQWWDLVPKYGQNGAAKVVAARLRHKSETVTWQHYIIEFENPIIQREVTLHRFRPIADLLHVPSQCTLGDSNRFINRFVQAQTTLNHYEEDGGCKTRLPAYAIQAADED